MKRHLMSAVFAVIGLFLGSAAQAQIYAGVSVGKMSGALSSNPCGLPVYTCSNEKNASVIRLGYKLPDSVFGHFWDHMIGTAIELSYARYSDLTVTGPMPPLSSSRWDERLRSVSIGTASEFPLTQNVSLVARIGASFYRTTETLSQGTFSMAANERHATEMYYGLGGIYRLTDKIALTGDLLISRAPFSRVSSREIHLLSAGLMYSF